MKPSPTRQRYTAPLACASLLLVLLATTSCSTTQVAAGNPHGTIKIQSRTASPDGVDYRVLKAIDGKAISFFGGSEYRLTPGAHEITFTEVRSRNPSYSRVTTSDKNRGKNYGEWSSTVTESGGTITQETDTIVIKVEVQAGRYYNVNGYGVSEQGR